MMRVYGGQVLKFLGWLFAFRQSLNTQMECSTFQREIPVLRAAQSGTTASLCGILTFSIFLTSVHWR
jgi:hypothetical protein